MRNRLLGVKLPKQKILGTTDLKRWPGLDALQFNDHIEENYIARRQNIALIGKHGAEKTKAALRSGLGEKALAEEKKSR